MIWATSASVLFIAYLLGSFPAGFVAGKLRGVDIRQHGSGNIGATNVLRTLGKPWGFAVFFIDALKGFVAVRIAIALVRHNHLNNYSDFFAILAAAACVIGHSFPVWLRFRGGKGVATSAGSVLGIIPIAAATVAAIWAISFWMTRYVSLASIIAAIALPIIVAVVIRVGSTHGVVLLYFSAIMTALVVWRHRSNIARLLNGTEPRFDRK